jgi:hypothetical protein
MNADGTNLHPLTSSLTLGGCLDEQFQGVVGASAEAVRV